MNDIRSTETIARHDLARRIEDGHLTREESIKVADLLRTVGVHAENCGHSVTERAATWDLVVTEYRRLVPEGGE